MIFEIEIDEYRKILTALICLMFIDLCHVIKTVVKELLKVL